MIKHRLVPDVEHAVSFECLLETVRPERAQRHCKKTKRSCNPKESDRHLDLVVCYLERVRYVANLFLEDCFSSQKRECNY
jgi:hypothetical protein